MLSLVAVSIRYLWLGLQFNQFGLHCLFVFVYSSWLCSDIFGWLDSWNIPSPFILEHLILWAEGIYLRFPFHSLKLIIFGLKEYGGVSSLRRGFWQPMVSDIFERGFRYHNTSASSSKISLNNLGHTDLWTPNILGWEQLRYQLIWVHNIQNPVAQTSIHHHHQPVQISDHNWFEHILGSSWGLI